MKILLRLILIFQFTGIKMKICATSDLHGYLPDIEPCDLLLICGDITPLDIQTNMPESERWLEEVFIPWVDSLPVDQVILIAGNHDFAFERIDRKVELILRTSKIRYLRNETTTYMSNDGETVTIFGTPYCKIFGGWAFMRSPEKLKEKYSEIPENVDILISHDAPMIGEVGMIKEGGWAGTEAGNSQLAEEIMKKKPKWCFCGHIHSGEHSITEHEGIKLANVSLVDETYKPTNMPMYVEV